MLLFHQWWWKTSDLYTNATEKYIKTTMKKKDNNVHLSEALKQNEH